MRADEAILLDMLLAARDALSFVHGINLPTFERESLRQRGVIQCLTVIGEGAVQVSDVTRQARPEIRWSGWIALRNVLVHQYFRISLARVWEIVSQGVPPLIAALEPLVPPETD